MTKEQLFEAINGIDDEILERSEIKKHSKWRTIIAVAACLILVAAAIVPKNDADQPLIQDGDDHTEGPQYLWNIYYNDVNMMADAEREYVQGCFTEELNEVEIMAIEPGMRIEWMEYSGSAFFDNEGNLIEINLTVTTTDPDNNIAVTISENPLMRDYVIEDEPMVSMCGDVEYRAYQCDLSEEYVILEADAEINGCYFGFSMDVSGESVDRAKEDFKQVLKCFTYYSDGEPDLSAVTAEYIPEWFDIKMTHEEALNDGDFGVYMLKNIPSGFNEESIRSYKDQNNYVLSGLWTREYDEISWRVRYFDESDTARLTSVENTESYDLSLYPIPRAESVPDELREIVDDPIFEADELTLEAVYARAYKVDDAGDGDGWRMNFSVRYGNVVVEVWAKGVEPEWIYEQLVELR